MLKIRLLVLSLIGVIHSLSMLGLVFANSQSNPLLTGSYTPSQPPYLGTLPRVRATLSSKIDQKLNYYQRKIKSETNIETAPRELGELLEFFRTPLQFKALSRSGINSAFILTDIDLTSYFVKQLLPDTHEYLNAAVLISEGVAGIHEISLSLLSAYLTQDLTPAGKTLQGHTLVFPLHHLDSNADTNLRDVLAKAPESLSFLHKTQLFIHLMTDVVIENHDTHLGQLGIDKHGNLLGFDKGGGLFFALSLAQTKRSQLSFKPVDTKGYLQFIKYLKSNSDDFLKIYKSDIVQSFFRRAEHLRVEEIREWMPHFFLASSYKSSGDGASIFENSIVENLSQLRTSVLEYFLDPVLVRRVQDSQSLEFPGFPLAEKPFNYHLDGENSSGASLFSYIRSNQIDELRSALASNPSLLHTKNALGESLLEFAILKEKPRMAQVLLNEAEHSHYHFQASSVFIESPLQLAIRNKFHEIALSLIQQTLRCSSANEETLFNSLNMSGVNHETPLSLSVYNELWDIAELLLSNLSSEEIGRSVGRLAQRSVDLSRVAAFPRLKEMLKETNYYYHNSYLPMLKELKSKIGAPAFESIGETAIFKWIDLGRQSPLLHFGIESGWKWDILTALISNSSVLDLELSDQNGNTLLHQLANSNYDIPDLNTPEGINSVMAIASKLSNETLARKNNRGNTVLHAWINHPGIGKLLKLFLTRLTDEQLFQVNKRGQTVLHVRGNYNREGHEFADLVRRASPEVLLAKDHDNDSVLDNLVFWKDCPGIFQIAFEKLSLKQAIEATDLKLNRSIVDLAIWNNAYESLRIILKHLSSFPAWIKSDHAKLLLEKGLDSYDPETKELFLKFKTQDAERRD